MVSSRKTFLTESITRLWHQFLEEAVKDLSLGTFRMGSDRTQVHLQQGAILPCPPGMHKIT